MDLDKILEETDFERVRERLARYIEETKAEKPETAPSGLSLYLPLDPDTSTLFTKERLRLLRYVRDHGPIPVGSLAGALKRGADAVSRDVRFLVNFGVLEIRRDANDARKKLVSVATGEIRIPLGSG